MGETSRVIFKKEKQNKEIIRAYFLYCMPAFYHPHRVVPLLFIFLRKIASVASLSVFSSFPFLPIPFPSPYFRRRERHLDGGCKSEEIQQGSSFAYQMPPGTVGAPFLPCPSVSPFCFLYLFFFKFSYALGTHTHVLK